MNFPSEGSAPRKSDLIHFRKGNDVKIFGIRSGDTRKKALALLVADDMAHESIDDRKSGTGWETRFDTRGPTWELPTGGEARAPMARCP